MSYDVDARSATSPLGGGVNSEPNAVAFVDGMAFVGGSHTYVRSSDAPQDSALIWDSQQYVDHWENVRRC